MPFPVNIKYIIETEQELELVFPDSFKAKMMKENGGELETGDDDWQLFPFFDKSDKKRMGRTCNHIVLETRQAQSWANFPGNGIAIASNGSGDLLILLPAKENGKKLGDEIFTWFHETGEIEKVADNIDELNPPVSEPVKKTQLKKQKLNSLKTDFGFCVDKVPSPWTLTETISDNKPIYTFQIGKGTGCIVSLETSFPAEQLNNDQYWLGLWIKETGLDYSPGDLTIERSEPDNYSCILVKSQNWIPVFYWFKSNLTDKWFLRMKTESGRHKGDFKEIFKLLNSIPIDRQ